jgi:hypothetical protein
VKNFIKNSAKNCAIATTLLLSSTAFAGPITYEFDISYTGDTLINGEEYQVSGTGFFSLFGELDFGINTINATNFSNFNYQVSFDFFNLNSPGNNLLNFASISLDTFSPQMLDFSLFVENNLNTAFWGNGGAGEGSFVVSGANNSGSNNLVTIYHEPTTDLDNSGAFLLVSVFDGLIIDGNNRNYAMTMRNSSLGNPLPTPSNDVPEPSSWMLLMAGLALSARRFKSK